MPAHLLVRSISPFPLPALLLHCNGRLRNLRIFYIFYEMRQTLSISVFVNFDLSFQPSDNLYTMLVRLCLLQFITKTYLSKNVNRRGASAGQSPSYGRCGVAQKKEEFASLAPAVAVPPPRTFPWIDRLCWLSLSKRNC
jgi:hypothetical protein